jgi:predicted dehydrogenase
VSPYDFLNGITHLTHKDIAIDAINAGKDAYSEKPMCRTRDEAPQMVKAARTAGRILQIGVQQRSGQVYLEPRERFVQSGAIGRISHIDAVWNSGVPRALPKEPAEKPANLDWLRFLGPVLIATGTRASISTSALSSISMAAR